MDVTLQFAVKLVTDLVLFIEPIPILWNLNLPRIKKAGLVIMFSLGLLYVAFLQSIEQLA